MSRRGQSQRGPDHLHQWLKCSERESAWKIGGWRTGQGVQHVASNEIFGHSEF
jgi:hypothetical protein